MDRRCGLLESKKRKRQRVEENRQSPSKRTVIAGRALACTLTSDTDPDCKLMNHRNHLSTAEKNQWMSAAMRGLATRLARLSQRQLSPQLAAPSGHSSFVHSAL